MRKNTRETINTWEAGRYHRRAPSIWTDGESVYSYGTALIEPVPDTSDVYLFNDTQYSTTTRIHQNTLLAHLMGRGFEVVVAYDVPMGTRNLMRYWPECRTRPTERIAS